MLVVRPHILTPPWNLNSRRSRSSSAKQFANSPKPRSAPCAGVGRSADLPARSPIKQLGKLGFLGVDLSRRARRRRAGLRRLRHHHRRACARRSFGRADRGRAQLALHQSYLSRRQRRAEAQVHPEAGDRRMDRLLVAHRA